MLSTSTVLPGWLSWKSRTAGTSRVEVAALTVPIRSIRSVPPWSPAAVRSRSTASSTSTMFWQQVAALAADPRTRSAGGRAA